MEKVKELEDDENPYMLIAIYDVNNLKKVNDTMGHQKGDEMIKRVADVMSASLGKYGQCYRVGGDEFVFISTKPDIETVFMNASKKMMDNLGCITDGNNIVPITAAMGYAVQNDNRARPRAFLPRGLRKAGRDAHHRERPEAASQNPHSHQFSLQLCPLHCRLSPLSLR